MACRWLESLTDVTGSLDTIEEGNEQATDEVLGLPLKHLPNMLIRRGVQICIAHKYLNNSRLKSA